MPAEYHAESYDGFLAFVARSIRKGTNYQLSASISQGIPIPTGEMTGCTRTYSFSIDDEVRATYAQEQVRYDNEAERQIDERQSLTDLMEDVAGYSSPRELEFGKGATGRFFMKKDLVIPQKGENPLQRRGDLKSWLREYFQGNGRKIPPHFTSLNLDQLSEIYLAESTRYGFSLQDIVPERRR